MKLKAEFISATEGINMLAAVTLRRPASCFALTSSVIFIAICISVYKFEFSHQHGSHKVLTSRAEDDALISKAGRPNLSQLHNSQNSRKNHIERSTKRDRQYMKRQHTSEDVWLKLQTLRRGLVEEECERLWAGKRSTTVFSMENLLTSSRYRLHNLLVDDVHQAIYCYVPKVACTQWKRIMMILTGQSDAEDPEKIYRIVAHFNSGIKALSHQEFRDEEVIERINKYKKFMFVRHPLERLLSAYINKFQGNTTDAKIFQKFYAHNMMAFARNDSKSVPMNGSGLKFQEFLYFLNHNDPLNFQEHWMPFFYLCHPCTIHYDFIGKFETIETDSNEILERIGAAPNIRFPEFVPSGTKNMLKLMTADVPAFVLHKMYNLYNLDFRLYGYTL